MEIWNISFGKMHLKTPFAEWWSFCLDFSVFKAWTISPFCKTGNQNLIKSSLTYNFISFCSNQAQTWCRQWPCYVYKFLARWFTLHWRLKSPALRVFTQASLTTYWRKLCHSFLVSFTNSSLVCKIIHFSWLQEVKWKRDLVLKVRFFCVSHAMRNIPDFVCCKWIECY